MVAAFVERKQVMESDDPLCVSPMVRIRCGYCRACFVDMFIVPRNGDTNHNNMKKKERIYCIPKERNPLTYEALNRLIELHKRNGHTKSIFVNWRGSGVTRTVTTVTDGFRVE